MIRALTLAILLATPAAAERALTQDDILSATLLSGWRAPDGRHFAALSLTLAPGWKTYWRSPGEAGIPPMLDFDGSRNLGPVSLRWPSPSVFEINGMQTIGYHDALILPIEVTPRLADQPVEMQLRVDLGVCKDICLPATLDLTATLPTTSTPDPAIRAALADRPRTGADAGVAAIHCTIAPISDGLRVTASLDMASLGGDEAVVVETPDPAIWVSQSDTSRAGSTLTAVTDLVPSSGAPFALDRSQLRVTVVGANGAVEMMGCPAP